MKYYRALASMVFLCNLLKGMSPGLCKRYGDSLINGLNKNENNILIAIIKKNNDIDPRVISYLIEEKKFDVNQEDDKGIV